MTSARQLPSASHVSQITGTEGMCPADIQADAGAVEQ